MVSVATDDFFLFFFFGGKKNVLWLYKEPFIIGIKAFYGQIVTLPQQINDIPPSTHMREENGSWDEQVQQKRHLLGCGLLS